MTLNLVWNKTRNLLEMIKFSHTVFAFPFALMGVVLASLENGTPPTGMQILWICLAMVGARSGAMALNRIIDARIDARNPRTAQRHLPAGKVGAVEAWALVIASFVLLIFSAWMLNPLCFFLSPVAIAFLVLYSYCKRFTAMAHLVLGLCLAAAPLGAWIALRGDIGWPAVNLGLAVLLWVAGFDIFYALQDMEFDREQGLYSIPARVGAEGSIILTRVFHAGMLVLLLTLLLVPGLGWLYFAGVCVVAGLLLYEHRLVKPDDLSRLDAAFFNMNGYISVTIFLFTLGDALL
ncbi:UbiA-like polyprenyltransferase [Geoalkalibacter subterraneus]|uniref:4-hydroxybenzoate polyprenyltransferase n=1 Tax=Geoalkalibacter subterraneus TaxID=483547 RepID=A0A0B5FB64_9BACT|nr:UbiA-like polyprenyltransferase [Geoalkalibacter subterraneus]AJF05407.1 prenyltransferase [Geoalkalibacter subterraneus]